MKRANKNSAGKFKPHIHLSAAKQWHCQLPSSFGYGHTVGSTPMNAFRSCLVAIEDRRGWINALR